MLNKYIFSTSCITSSLVILSEKFSYYMVGRTLHFRHFTTGEVSFRSLFLTKQGTYWRINKCLCV